MDRLAVPTIAATIELAVNNPTVRRIETESMSKPAASGPSGIATTAMLVAAVVTREVSLSGVMAKR